ncbi:DUF262 domain-containing protein [Trichormus variabilis]|uniref:DUF262 domain-containing protein n=1 Tax=Trichormus variabilis SAG 1403-4b TaxID=447716 RepID=A0A3S1IGT5_ANAVA|nr:DUF262 domain-containing protein [Trichormus variabilis]MBD2627815.1 DUF262 domain-containing protein [Trichormus variabilis FACHB-164]RUS97190.1 hypothetical protein DSM107003_19310 [Trichormus variabilis SAG 1403-4b]
MAHKIVAEKKVIHYIYDDFWFIIPEYQRSYVWKNDNINELLDDLWFAFETKYENEYFLGSLVLKKTEETNFNEYEVLDGQQRLTTFLILMAVLRDITENEKLKDACHEKIIQEEDKFRGVPKRIRIIYKIRDNVEKFINEYIARKDGTKDIKIVEYCGNKNVSISHIANAILTMQKFFSEKESHEIENFGAYVGLKPVLIYVSTENQEDAFRLFTILNNRGTPLTNSDILKSINIGEISDLRTRDNYAKKWEEIEGDFGNEFDRFLSFIRTILVKEKARLSLLDEFEENIYKKNLLKKGKDTIDYIITTKENYDKIITLTNGIDIENEYKNLVTIMNFGLSSSDWIAPLLAFYYKFENSNLLEFLKKLEYKFSSDWILQYTPTQRSDNMSRILKEIEKSNNSQDILSNKTIFDVNKAELYKTLNGEIYGKQFAKYILLKYEYLNVDHTVHLSGYKTISVEHILPQNPKDSSQWKSVFTDDERKNWTNKLGNIVLISTRKNSTLSNLDFEEKKERYFKGKIDIFPSSKIFATYKEWNTTILETRQNEMLSKLIQ